MAAPLQAAIQHLMDNGTYEKIVTKWGLQSGAVKKAPLNPTNAQHEQVNARGHVPQEDATRST